MADTTTKTETDIEVRPIGPDDMDAMAALDEESEYDIYEDYVDDIEEDANDCLWGVFDDGELKGFCVMCDADDPDFPDVILNHPLNTSGSIFLSNVFVTEDARDAGYGTRLVHDAIAQRFASDGEAGVFLDIADYLDDSEWSIDKLEHFLIEFFERVGFTLIKDDPDDDTITIMVLDPKNLTDPTAE